MTAPRPTQNSSLVGVKCIRCDERFPVQDFFEGCPLCLEQGFPASVAPEFSVHPSNPADASPNNWLVYTDIPKLGEGQTPLVAMPDLADELGVMKVWLKNEGANPTGSHKDRMSPLMVKRAIEVGANTVAAASSGNAGVSLAAYAAADGLECALVTTANISPNWRRAAEFFGARLYVAESSEQRWAVLQEKVKQGAWYPATNYLAPAVGSNPFGVDGYKSIAVELFQQSVGELPTDVVVPTSRADLLWGIANGFSNLFDAGVIPFKPKVHAVEPHARIVEVLLGCDYRSSFPGDSRLVSIGGSTVTYQALHALELCGGRAVVADEKSALKDQKHLARHGFYLELSSASSLTGLKCLRGAGVITDDSRVVLLATSHGYKEEADFAAPLKIGFQEETASERFSVPLPS